MSRADESILVVEIWLTTSRAHESCLAWFLTIEWSPASRVSCECDCSNNELSRRVVTRGMFLTMSGAQAMTRLIWLVRFQTMSWANESWLVRLFLAIKSTRRVITRGTSSNESSRRVINRGTIVKRVLLYIHEAFACEIVVVNPHVCVCARVFWYLPGNQGNTD